MALHTTNPLPTLEPLFSFVRTTPYVIQGPQGVADHAQRQGEVALFHAPAGIDDHRHAGNGFDVGRQQRAALRLPPVGFAVGEVAETRRAAHGVLDLGQQFSGRVNLGVKQLGGGAGQSARYAATAPLLLILFDGLGDRGFHEVLVVLRQAGMLL